ncbi:MULTISPECIES: type II toxin-antitoxin system VapC family toxin [Halomonas]|uniref:type II toxin-antitoxin system VapC family toxin n=1 Tax=Halomonas TaxID=2745 RepID=UPI001C937C9F|nr:MULTISPECIES: type II toxin-antitoxin system VapC family toxin [Halomonas]MBY6208626.1 type II toxin-antitoxin system VapC family toxin [Halomonas sp. DP3Y7-2]MBY6227097.1 type II toxin-antitoxin system VapC family toxin [Halomonas sp. DP3Y7-1]MCA0915155.1 type II toxin-antitoxin system VapC family toxin [Halomonas denitrificans]
MIVLDTNVLSELIRPVPNARVVDWLDRQDAISVTISAITVAEILYGIERLPDGRRKRGFAAMAAAMFEEDFSGCILSFDSGAAIHYAEQVAASESAGRQVHMADAQIAAICIQHGAVLVTRNVKDFETLSVETTNPWEMG